MALARARGESGAAAEAVQVGRAPAAGVDGAGAGLDRDRARPRLCTRSSTAPSPISGASSTPTLRPDLSDLASAFLRDLTNGRYTELELDEDYGATLLDDGDPKAVISGGEEDVANLALRLAISQMIAERAGQPLSLLVLDEIFGSLDEDRRYGGRGPASQPGRPLPPGHPHHPHRFGARRVRPGDPGRAGRRERASRRRETSRWRGTMWRPDRSVRGPDRPGYRDIDPLNRVFAEAFTDRYSRDGLVGVRVPQLNPLVWRYAIDDAGDGAMVWRDVDGHMVAFNMVHRSGTEGWMGPLAVRPDRQGEGLGSLMVRTGIDWLRDAGRDDHRPGDHAAHGGQHRLLQPDRPGARAPDGHAGARRVPAGPSAEAELLSKTGGAHRIAASSECRRLVAVAAPGRGLHPRDRADPGARHRRHHADPREPASWSRSPCGTRRRSPPGVPRTSCGC